MLRKMLRFLDKIDAHYITNVFKYSCKHDGFFSTKKEKQTKSE